jgi:hypothetical protein
LDLDLLNVVGDHTSCAPQAVGHARRGCSGFVGALDVFANLDGVRKHTCDTIELCDQITGCGWVGFRQQIGFDLLDGVAASFSITGSTAGAANSKA